ncbi:MAG: 50S ribosomal protein L1 [Candidatus Hecatellales archaeon B24]|nr:MAG: 50S ribosomal protein L1 [Candidatus Hecatellales archaeon B24]
MQVDAERLKKALEEAAGKAKRNFTQSMELIVKIKDVDLKRPENRFNELVELPNPHGKNVKICVIASGQMAVEAKKVGADAVLQKDDLERLAGDRKAARELAKDYDFFAAEAPLMPLVGRILGPLLGPRGKMPTPIPPNSPLSPVVERFRRTIRIRLKDQPTIQCRIGNEKMEASKLAENALAVIRRLEEKLEKGARNIDKVYVKTTMGSPVKVEAGKR